MRKCAGLISRSSFPFLSLADAWLKGEDEAKGVCTENREKHCPLIVAHQMVSAICPPSSLLQSQISGTILPEQPFSHSHLANLHHFWHLLQLSDLCHCYSLKNWWQEVPPSQLDSQRAVTALMRSWLKSYLFHLKTRPCFHGTFSSFQQECSAAFRPSSTDQNIYELRAWEEDLHPIVFCCICLCHKFKHLKTWVILLLLAAKLTPRDFVHWAPGDIYTSGNLLQKECLLQPQHQLLAQDACVHTCLQQQKSRKWMEQKEWVSLPAAAACGCLNDGV